MAHSKETPARAGGTVTGALVPLLGGGNGPKNSTPPPRLQYLAKRLHSLGPKPVFHFLTEIERGAPLIPTLEVYTSLPTDFVQVFGGDRFPPPFVVKGRKE